MYDLDSRQAEIKDYYERRATTHKYATSPDFNLREVELEHISRYLHDNEQVLDAGCGNGYSTAIFASRSRSRFIGLDFSPGMIDCARQLVTEFPLIGEVHFQVGDVLDLPFGDATLDTVITQRLLINLPSPTSQKRAISEIARVLKPGGRYLMMEQSLQGWENLNRMRERFGLAPIPAANSATNWFNIKFNEEELRSCLSVDFEFLDVHRFGMYFFISRVIHPLLVAPEEPQYDAKINEIARQIAFEIPNYEDLGHMVFYVLRKRSPAFSDGGSVGA